MNLIPFLRAIGQAWSEWGEGKEDEGSMVWESSGRGSESQGSSSKDEGVIWVKC